MINLRHHNKDSEREDLLGLRRIMLELMEPRVTRLAGDEELSHPEEWMEEEGIMDFLRATTTDSLDSLCKVSHRKCAQYILADTFEAHFPPTRLFDQRLSERACSRCAIHREHYAPTCLHTESCRSTGFGALELVTPERCESKARDNWFV